MEDEGFKKEIFSTAEYPTYYKESDKTHKYVCDGRCVIDVPSNKQHHYYPIQIKEAIMALSEEKQIHPIALLLEILYK